MQQRTKAMAAVLVMMASLVASDAGAAPSKTKEMVSFELYIMSKCPFAAKVIQTLAPLKATFGDQLDVSIQFIAKAQDGGAFWSLHGPSEVQADIVELCIIAHEPAETWPMLACMYPDYKSLPGSWLDCAATVGMSTKAVEKCIDGPEGEVLLTASIDRTNKRSVKGSPTMFINGKKYSGSRTTQDFTKAICDAFRGTKPSQCP